MLPPDYHGIPRSTVSSTLNRAAKAGEVQALAHGTWAIPAAA
ncbi:hypothetical protein OG612_42670 (plasmid) [Streptomyces sp. NBC_01527]|nr:hypothetical protein OG763_45535 [Streptomyces sp. NBC_01230]